MNSVTTHTTSKKEAIIAAACKLFKQYGYAATSMRMLANELGIEASSIYSHIKSKEEILHHICFDMAHTFFNNIDEVLHTALSSTDKLKLAISTHINTIIDNLDASPVFFHDWRHLNEIDLIEFRALRDDYEKIFRDIIKDGIQKSEFIKIDSKFTVLTLFSAMNWIYEWYKPEGKMNASEIAEQIFNVIYSGLQNSELNKSINN